MLRTFRERGNTLLEVMVASTLGMLLITMGQNFLVPMWELQSLGTQRATQQRVANSALRTIGQEIRKTTPSGLSLLSSSAYSDTPVVLSVHPIAGVTTDGTIAYEPYVSLFIWERTKGQLTHHRYYNLGDRDPSRVAHFEPDELAQIAKAPGSLVKILAQDVTDVVVEHQAGAGSYVTPPMILELELSGELPDKPYRLRETIAGRTPGA